jgi:hypothetical protein
MTVASDFQPPNARRPFIEATFVSLSKLAVEGTPPRPIRFLSATAA